MPPLLRDFPWGAIRITDFPSPLSTDPVGYKKSGCLFEGFLGIDFGVLNKASSESDVLRL